MKGFPKHLNSKTDVDIALAIDAEKTKSIISSMLAAEKDWFFSSRLASKDDGINDSTHKIVCEDSSVEESLKIWLQYELKDCPSSPLSRIGLSQAAAQKIVEG